MLIKKVFNCMKNDGKRKTGCKNKKIIICIAGVLALLVAGAAVALCLINVNARRSLVSTKKSVIEGKNLSGKDIDNTIEYAGKTYVYNSDLVNILVLGTDSDKGISQTSSVGNMGQSDAMYLVSVDTKKKDIHIYGIPRDSMTAIEIYDDNNRLIKIADAQITLQYAFGDSNKRSAGLSAKSVSGLLYNLPVNRVCVFNYDAITTINDSVGGVEVTFENEFTDESGEIVDPEFVKGNTITLTGEQAGKFLRERDCSIEESAMDRLARQEMYISHLLDKVMVQVKKNPFKILDIEKQLKNNDCIYTDISSTEMLYLSSIVKGSGIDMDGIVTIPGTVKQGEEYEEYHVDSSELKKLIIDDFYVEK